MATGLRDQLMQDIRSILVVIQPDLADGLALKRAKLIASTTGSHLHLLVCNEQHDYTTYLADWRNALDAKGFSCSVQQAWLGSEQETIINAQQDEGCGLVIKQHKPDSPLKKLLLTPDDWKLLRYCPCPILLVKSDRPWTGGAVLAAVDVASDDDEHKALHAEIIDHGYQIAEMAKSELHVISAHPLQMLAVTDPGYQMCDNLDLHFHEACQAFKAQYDIADTHLHMADGPVGALIPHVAQQLHAVVTVMGTVARSGLYGALIGNTCEEILDKLESDILVLKPDSLIQQLLNQGGISR
jgi:universal stress protein E